MNSTFDSLAKEYDLKFTQTKIGRAQRKIVWAYLNKCLAGREKLKILELNCGTGEDAIWFAKKGHSVLATDISEKMLQATAIKAEKNNLDERIKTRKIDLTKIGEYDSNEPFDLIFSNFGGINCISLSDLYSLPRVLVRLLKSSGRLIMVIMPTSCLWETIYFTLKLNLKKAFRRSSKNGVIVNLKGVEVLINYYTPILLNRIFLREFAEVALKPVGFFIPPSYLEKFFSTKNKTFNFINYIESSITDWSYLAKYSDHFLIDFVKK